MDITGKKLIVKALTEEGVDTVFAYPGGMITDILDELTKAPNIHLVLARHEQALIHEAEGYARATGKTAVCLVTSGPGATNTITGIADAHYDSIPLLVITGQVAKALIGNDAFQEVDIVGMTRNITKYTVTVNDRKELGRRLKMGFHIARTGKPGPVLIDIPKDIQLKNGDPEYPKEVHIRGYKPNESVHIGQLKKGYKLLKSAKRPIIIAGGGVKISKANDLLTQFAKKMNIPVATTIMGKGAFPEDDPLYIGNCGMHGRYAANMAIGNCDVLFSIGTRFNDRITGDLNEFAPKAKIIHVDVDTASISRNVVVDVPVVSDATLALEKLVEWAEEMNTEKWLREIYAWENENPLGMRRDKGMTPQMIMEGINKTFEKAFITTDVGQHQMWATQYIKLTKDREMITSGGLGTMGFGFPAAVGAAIALKEENKDVVCITGDGGFQMNMQEMATAINEGRSNITVCIINNKYLGMVRQFQQVFYGKRYIATDLKTPEGACVPEGSYVPDFVKWAESYGAKGIRVTEEKDIEEALKKAKANKKTPTVIEFVVSSEEIVLPMVKGGTAMTEMILK